MRFKNKNKATAKSPTRRGPPKQNCLKINTLKNPKKNYRSIT